MEKNAPHNITQTFKTRQITRVFEPIEDEIALITANAQFKYTTCKTDQNTLKLTLAYIEDTKRIIIMLKARMELLQESQS
ncbi:MAG: hypothetical protein NWE92_08800 [Candidatus Bathyarchaeota archaeon]|nr:hypothetical protein [Candidatus Bathyarchaeota archaeon]